MLKEFERKEAEDKKTLNAEIKKYAKNCLGNSSS